MKARHGPPCGDHDLEPSRARRWTNDAYGAIHKRDEGLIEPECEGLLRQGRGTERTAGRAPCGLLGQLRAIIMCRMSDPLPHQSEAAPHRARS
jgi:hypothetical protein